MAISAACVLLLTAFTVGGEGIEFSLSDDSPSDAEIVLAQAQGSTGAANAPSSSSSTNPSSTANNPNSATNTPPNPNQNRAQQNPYARLARVPNMFGDTIPPASTTFLRTCNVGMQSAVITEVLTGGGARYSAIGENNRPLPTDRVFFTYNGFYNAATTTDLVAANSFDSDLFRYTLGFEKTFFEGQSSIEVRLPLVSSIDINIGDYSSSTGDIGNLMLVTKHLLLKTDDTAIAMGLGIGTPTGDDFTAVTGAARVQLNNEAVYLLPYLGWSKTINEDWFSIVYAQLDVATSGDSFIVDGQGSLGKLNAPTFARFDVSMGRWLMKDLGYQYLDGIAAIGEFHYVTTLRDSDTVIGGDGINSFALTNVDNRIDYLNCTVGMHAQLTQLSNLRVAGVFPMRNDPDRQFDSELQIAFNRNF